MYSMFINGRLRLMFVLIVAPESPFHGAFPNYNVNFYLDHAIDISQNCILDNRAHLYQIKSI